MNGWGQLGPNSFPGCVVLTENLFQGMHYSPKIVNIVPQRWHYLYGKLENKHFGTEEWMVGVKGARILFQGVHYSPKIYSRVCITHRKWSTLCPRDGIIRIENWNINNWELKNQWLEARGPEFCSRVRITHRKSIPGYALLTEHGQHCAPEMA